MATPQQRLSPQAVSSLARMVKKPATQALPPGARRVRDVAADVVRLAFRPVAFVATTTGSIVQWAGGELSRLSRRI